MPASIVKQRLLRTGAVDFSSTTATSQDEYLVRISERADKETVAELFVAYSGNPVPKATLKELGSAYLLCDKISVQSEKSQSLLFKVVVSWKELENSEPPQNQSFPRPNSGSTDPMDWAPTWTRRGQVIFDNKTAPKLYYKGGFTGLKNQEMSGITDRNYLQNSAGDRYPGGIEVRRNVSVWNIRWLRQTVASSLVGAEHTINSVAFDITIPGYNFTFDPHTVLFDSLNLTKYKWGNVNLVEISVELFHDPKGFYLEILDEGFSQVDYSASNNSLDPSLASTTTILGQDKRRPTEPVRLNGNGKFLAATATSVYGIWSDYEESDFNNVALLNALIFG